MRKTYGHLLSVDIEALTTPGLWSVCAVYSGEHENTVVTLLRRGTYARAVREAGLVHPDDTYEVDTEHHLVDDGWDPGRKPHGGGGDDA